MIAFSCMIWNKNSHVMFYEGARLYNKLANNIKYRLDAMEAGGRLTDTVKVWNTALISESAEVPPFLMAYWNSLSTIWCCASLKRRWCTIWSNDWVSLFTISRLNTLICYRYISNFCLMFVSQWANISCIFVKVVRFRFFLLSEFFFYPLLGRARFRGRCWAAIRLSHRPEPSGRAVCGEVDGLDIDFAVSQ